jgi:hypothetical protein
LAALAWGLAWRLRQREPRVEWSRRLWAWGLTTQGIGAFLGGVAHGFPDELPEPVRAGVWLSTLIALGVASALLVSGLGVVVLRRQAVVILVALLAVKFAALGVWVGLRGDFFPALCDQALGMVLIGWLTVVGRDQLAASWRLLALGLAAAVVGASIQLTGISLGPVFNHNVIYHLFGAVTLICFARAGRAFVDLLGRGVDLGGGGGVDADGIPSS